VRAPRQAVARVWPILHDTTVARSQLCQYLKLFTVMTKQIYFVVTCRNMNSNNKQAFRNAHLSD